MKSFTRTLTLLVIIIVIPLINTNASVPLSSAPLSSAPLTMDNDTLPIPIDNDQFTNNQLANNRLASTQWVLNENIQQQILWNNQTIDNFASEILTSFDTRRLERTTHTPQQFAPRILESVH